MKHRWVFFLLGCCLLMTSACNSASPRAGGKASIPSTPVVSTKTSQKMGTFFAINEVGLGQNGFVALTNFTDVPASLAGLYLCQGSACAALPDVLVDAGKTARVAVGDGAGIAEVVSVNAALGEMRPSDGEIALLASLKQGDPQALLAYFQWGATPHQLTQAAIDAGLWVQGGYGPSSPNAIRLYKVAETGLWLFDER